MLFSLHIKNVALIEESEINFGEGLNILSGETGAGKSMIIDSINFVLGDRASRNFLRTGEKLAAVEALFYVDKTNIPLVNDLFSKNGIDIQDDGSILIVRTLNSSGKSVYRINGNIVTSNIIKLVSEILIDVHGQHEHQSLLNPKRHIILLDKFCGVELEKKKLILKNLYNEFLEIEKQIKLLSGNEEQRENKIDFLSFQIEEIENASLKDGEEEELYERRKILSNAEKIIKLSSETVQLLFDSYNGEQTAYDKISNAISNLNEILEVDTSVNEMYKTLLDVSSLLNDVCYELKNYANNIEIEPDEINIIEERINLIYNLKRKYGKTIKDILEYYENIKKELNFILNSEKTVKKLLNKKEILIKELESTCKEISDIRSEKAKNIEGIIENELKELEMKNAIFKISMERKKTFSSNGWDNIEFLISPNPGEDLKPLSKIASGGEMSRIMLALKTVLAKVDNIETFIFDEIDAGVSGRTAQKVAEKMSIISKKQQIICITHLPQIAAMADNHFLIEKGIENNRTFTKAYELNKNLSVEEIARLMGGAKITDTTISAAKEMKILADEFKKRN